MQKILLAIDAQNIKTATIDFACFIANMTRSKLTGVFLENIVSEEMTELARATSRDNEFRFADERNKKTDDNICFFREACEKRGVTANIHRKRGEPTDEMLWESRFADLIILDPEISFQKKSEHIPTGFIKEVLAESECPAIIAPENFDAVDEIIFTYNGSGSSVLAMKQFAYLFPELSNKKITILEVNKADEIALRSKPKITEWLKSHYGDFTFELLTGDPQEELFKYVLRKKNLFLVMGAYGRGTLSSLFKPSRATLIVKTTDLPIFITHH